MFGFGNKDEANREAMEIRSTTPIDDVRIPPYDPRKDIGVNLEPHSILNRAIAKLESERDYHAGEMMRLEEIIADANARLLNHTAAHDAISNALRPLIDPIEFETGDLESVQQTANSGIGATEFPVDGSIGASDGDNASNDEPRISG